MDNPLILWSRDHAHFRQLLAVLQREVDKFHCAGVPNYQLMLDIITYLREFGDQCHHLREDEAFRRLVRRCPDRELPVARLLQEHRVIAHAGESLRAMLEAVLGGEVVLRADIEIAAATYLVYYGNHIAREEEDILPRTARELTAEDWLAIRDAALRKRALAGQAEERLDELRRRIAAQKELAGDSA